MSTSLTAGSHDLSLDGLRDVGICSLLAYHLDVGAASGAFLSLSLFFTLSGYLIAGQLLAQHAANPSINPLAFWERRIRRPLPASILGLPAAGRSRRTRIAIDGMLLIGSTENAASSSCLPDIPRTGRRTRADLRESRAMG